MYHAREFAPDRWHIIDESGIPLYDGDRYGNDRPKVFDYDNAVRTARELNEQDNRTDEP